MIDVTRHVPSRRTVDGPALGEFEHVSCAARLAPIRFFTGDAPAAIGRDIGTALDRFYREKTQSGAGAAKAKDARGHQPPIAAKCFAVTAIGRQSTDILLRLSCLIDATPHI